MITLNKLKEILAEDAAMYIMLPSGEFVPEHFHITEVGLVRKNFMDCGRIKRETASCVLQVWVANDKDHRIRSSKLGMILKAAELLFGGEDFPVEIEYDNGFISQYPLGDIEKTPKGLLFVLGGKHTACLAPDKCGVSECGSSGCC